MSNAERIMKLHEAYELVLAVRTSLAASNAEDIFEALCKIENVIPDVADQLEEDFGV